MSIQEEDRLRYVQVLREIRARTNFAGSMLQAANQSRAIGEPLGLAGGLNLEMAALHLRKVLELIVFGSLVTNRQHVQKVAAALEKKDVEAARKLAKRANPQYWPEALLNKEETERRHRTGPRPGDPMPLEPRPDGFLREDEWGRALGETSEVLHARNPYAPAVDLERKLEKLRDLRGSIIGLLNHHKVTLVERDYILVCLMQTDGGDVLVAVFQEVPLNPPS